MPINVWHNSSWKETDKVYVRRAGVWKQVLAAKVWTRVGSPDGAPRWVPMFDNYQEPPHVVYGGTVRQYTSATISWPAPPGATHYKVLMHTWTASGWTQPAEQRPAPADEWMTANSYTWNGLGPGMYYRFSVIAKRTVSGVDILGEESPPIHLYMGTPETRNTRAPFEWVVSANRTGSYDGEKKWARQLGTPPAERVAQGHAKAQENTNSRGCVRYPALYPLLRNVGAPYGVAPEQIWIGAARIARIGRHGDNGTERPAVQMYCGTMDFGSTTAPTYVDNAGLPMQRQTAPKINSSIPASYAPGPIPIPVNWAREWAKASPRYNGIVIRRSDDTGNDRYGYDGWCVLTAISTVYTEHWDLVLTLSWDFVTHYYEPPQWWY